MKIKVIREAEGEAFSAHVYFYAWSERDDEFYFCDGWKKTYAIKYDFYSQNETVIEAVDDPNSYDEDHNSVILHSTQKFADFCHALKYSTFSNGYSFDIVKKNCVNSVLFALEKANIIISLDEARKCKHLVSCLCCPSTFITPRELIGMLKDQSIFQPVMNHTSNDEETALMRPNVLRKLEERAIRYGRISTGFAVATVPLTLATMGISVSTALKFASASDPVPVVPFVICLSATMSALCIPWGASCFFKRKEFIKAREIKQEYTNTYGEIAHAARVF